MSEITEPQQQPIQNDYLANDRDRSGDAFRWNGVSHSTQFPAPLTPDQLKAINDEARAKQAARPKTAFEWKMYAISHPDAGVVVTNIAAVDGVPVGTTK